jgi:hypothetical protein
MKKRILIAFTALIIFGLFAAVYAYNRSATSHHTADSCCAMANCCEDGKCKMGGDCCKKHDSCPMKDKENVAASVDMSKVIVVGEAKSCCTSGASCCNGGACCKKEKSAS